MKNIEGRSSFTECESRDCKIRSLSMNSISCCTRPHFLLHLRHWKKVQETWTFFHLLVSDDVKANITQRLSTKTHPKWDLLSGFWCKLQNLLWNYIKQKKKIMVWKTDMSCFKSEKQLVFQKFFKIVVLQNSANITEKIMCWSHFLGGTPTSICHFSVCLSVRLSRTISQEPYIIWS